MGSAVCFPVEALVFYALTAASLHRQGMPLQLALRKTYVYGDDIIIPHGFFQGLQEDFARYHLRFNPDKCCISGKFRESCGSDMYDGTDVTPIRMKKVYPRDVDGSIPIIPLVRHSNNLYEQGYVGAAAEFRILFCREYPVIGAMNLPHSPHSDLPVLTLLSSGVCEVPSSTKRGITRIKGWVLSKEYLAVPKRLEASCLREVLCHGGPLGRITALSGRKVVSYRSLETRFPSLLKFEEMSVHGGFRHSSSPTALQLIVELQAKEQRRVGGSERSMFPHDVGRSA